jgi:Ca2+-binding RTX toxin-like protein
MAIDLANVAAGSGGFVIHGQDAGDRAGRVSSAGDINGDGFDDLIIGAYLGDGPGNTRDFAGDSYVVFGKASGFAAELDLATVAAGLGGFVIHGQDAHDEAGYSVSSAGDVNGDGFDDLIIGNVQGDGPGNTRYNAGDSYVVFGHAGSFAAEIDLAAVGAGAGGFVIHGQDAGDVAGRSVSSAGDINGDGFADVIIGAPFASGIGPTRIEVGDSYVVFGHAGGFTAEIDLSTIATGVGGFVMHGADALDESGRSVSSAGDVNGDGFDEFIIGASSDDHAGHSYVLFGKASGFAAEIDLGANNGRTVIEGQDGGDESGRSVSAAGDINGDGFDDLIIGADGADGPGNTRNNAGDSYVVFGKASGFGTSIDLAVIATGNGGFVIHGEEAFDGSGQSVSSAGDVNGDGFDDLLIGAPGGGGPGNTRSGAGDSYVVFGKASGFAAEIDLAAVAGGAGGFVIHGQDAGDRSGLLGVSGAGDVNGDGFDDLIIGAPGGDGPANTRSYAGDSYVLFGSGTIGGSIDHVTHLGTAAADILTGNAAANDMVGGLGDDALFGGGGADVLRGGTGNDSLVIADTGFLRVVGGEGFDTLAFSGGITMADADFRRIEGIESIRLGNGATNLTLGAIASHAIDGVAANTFLVIVDGAAVTNAAVAIAAGGFTRALSVNLANDAATVQLVGGSGSDLLVGGSGNDSFQGGAGADAIAGGAGIDVVSYLASTLAVGVNLATGAGSGGDAAGDILVGIENLIGSNQGDILTGDGGINLLAGLGGADTIHGGGGNDTLDGGADNDTLDGGLGDDSYTVDSSGDVIIESPGEGVDQVFSSVTYTLPANVENLSLIGTAVSGHGNGLSNVITGNAEGNLLDGGTGVDVLSAGIGDDIYFVDDPGDAVFENAAQGDDTVISTVHFALSANVETLLLLGPGDLQGYGNALVNTIIGDVGNNLIDGGAAADSMRGSTGDDSYFVDDAGDAVVENAAQGNDTVFSTVHFALPANVETLILQGGAALQGYGNGLVNTIFGNTGNNLIDGGAAADSMSGGAGDDTYFVDNAGDAVTENAAQGNDAVFASVNYGLSANIETLVLQGGADLQGYGNASVNTLYGNTGNNLLNGQAGPDLMVGGVGNDTYFVDDTSDAAFESPGQGDDAVFSSAHYGLAADVETLVLQGGADLQGYGNNQANTLYGNSGNNLLNGASGVDAMYGGTGNDVYFVDNGLDRVVENAGEGADAIFSTVHFILPVNVETLVLQGGSNANGTGNELANAIFGDSSNNVLDGQGNADTLTGGAGNDAFVFIIGQGNGDTIVDFAGNGAAAGDALHFIGYGAGATFTNVDLTHWQVNFNGGASREVITFLNGAAIDPTDVLFS